MAIVVRRPTLTDVDELARINIDTWRSAYAGIVPQSQLDGMDAATYRDRWIRYIGRGPEQATFVAEVDGVVAGYAVGGRYRAQQDALPEDTTGWAEVFAIYVDPQQQGHGVGVAVHDALLGWLTGEEYTEVALWVLEGNEKTQSWYRRRGWRADGSTSLWRTDEAALLELRMRRGLPIS